jgi:beta-glucosidase
MNIKKMTTVAVLLLSVFAVKSQPVDYNAAIDKLIGQMTLAEKINMLHGTSKFTSGGVPRLGIPEFTMSDGPHGVRYEFERDTWNSAQLTTDSSTYLPAVTALSATWNPQMAFLFGSVLGNEANARGKYVILAPGMNIHRTPLNGRNFEYMGEDPYQVSRLSVEFIKGVQSQDVAACAKHYALNNQEYLRGDINVELDERTLREIYLPAFEASVKEGNVLTFMGAYNKVRGLWCCENPYLLTDILKKEWGFKGFVMSDWSAVHSTIPSALAGLDVEMGSDSRSYRQYYMAEPLLKAVKEGKVPESVINDKVHRILYVMYTIGVMNHNRIKGELSTSAHQLATRQIAEESIVLLKNDKNFLPATPESIKRIVVVGENANRKFALAGGSSEVKTPYEITPLQGLRNIYPNAEIIYTEGYSSKDNANSDSLRQNAITTIKGAQLVVFVGGYNKSQEWKRKISFDNEGDDKLSIKLPFGQDQLLSSLVAVNPNIAVVLIGCGPFEMGSWLKKVPAVLAGWYLGMEGGNALAEVISGKINPSGKLPMTFPVKLEDSPAHAIGEYPGKDSIVHYKEGLLVGYRYFDTRKVTPLYCFGHGLSYTTFLYSKPEVSDVSKNDEAEVSLVITNTGKKEGQEVVQLYVHEQKPTVMRPEKELKSFVKVSLKPGESKKVTLKLNKRSFSYYSPEKKDWVANKGKYDILIGSSSRDIRQKAVLILQ